MMKKRILYIMGALLVLLTSCERTSVERPTDDRVLELMVQSEGLRSFVHDRNSDQILFQWDLENTEIQIVYKQDEQLVHVTAVQDEQLGENGLVKFILTIPSEIDVTKPFDLYGIVADRVRVERGKILVGVEARSTYELLFSSSNRDSHVPVYFELKSVRAAQKQLSTTFKHLGAMAVITVKNSSHEPLRTAGFALLPHNVGAEFYHKGALPFEGNTELPYLDLLNPSAQPELILSQVDYPMVEAAAGDVIHVGFWFMPTTSMSPDIDLVAYQHPEKQVLRSTTSLPQRALKRGEAYAVYAEWNGAELKLLEEEPVLPIPAGLPKAMFKTNKTAGDEVMIGVLPRGRDGERFAFVDLNGNGTVDKGEYITDITKEVTDNRVVPYELQSSTFAIYGDLELLQVIDSGITEVDLSEMPQLKVLDLWDNDLTKVDLSSNEHLSMVAIEKNELKEVTFPSTNRIQYLFLDENKLESLDIKHLSVLTQASIKHNELEAEALNHIYTDLPKVTDTSAYWKYKLYVGGNPGVAKSNQGLVANKGWTLITKERD